MVLKNKKQLYFLGIGGIGMSALARYFNAHGYAVCGYDKTSTSITNQLIDEGITISFQDTWTALEENLHPQDTLVVYTPAIPSDHTLFGQFNLLGFTLIKRAQVLGEITKNTINLSVAGTHGKTTTSSIVASIFQQSNRAFTAFLGGISTHLNSNYYHQEGHGDWFSITEADEFDRSFLQLRPSYTVITSTDADHLDIYQSKRELEASYQEFSALVADKSHVFYAQNVAQYITGASYSATDQTADFYAVVHKQDSKGTHFSIYDKTCSVVLDDLFVRLPGIHNLENAVGASLMCLRAGVDKHAITQGLASFQGIKRRFQYIIERDDLVYIDDYAHHPSELKAIISSVKKLYPGQAITAIFQPHLYSRTKDFMVDFARELSEVDELILLPIYPARELPIEGVTSAALMTHVNHTRTWCLSKEELLSHLTYKNPPILLTLGAGDIDQLVQPIAALYGH